MFVDNYVSINQRYSAIVTHNYLSEVEPLNFTDSRGSAGLINKWVKEITQGNIRDLVTEDSVSNSVLLLINALYFQGTWRQGFNKTFVSGFTTPGGKKVDKPFMERTGNFYYFYSKHLDSKILRIPYSGRRFSMFIILPNEAQSLDAVVELLSSETIKNEVWHMDEVEVHAVLPKFKFDTSLKLNDVVKRVNFAYTNHKKTLNFCELNFPAGNHRNF